MGSDVPGINQRLSFDYKVLAPIFRCIWAKAACLVACSNGLRERANKFLPNVDIKVIPNGVDLYKFKPVSKSTEKTSFRLLTVGRLSSTKRLELLISAIQLICKKYPDIKLTIVGDGSPDPELKQQPDRLGISNKVTFLGRIPHDQISEVYQQHDIFVSATAQEGMSNAMLEAMASGLPIITTRCEGLEELICDNGIVVEKANANEIAKAIIRLIKNQNTYKKMSLAARKHAEKFSWKNVALKYMQYYDYIKQKPGHLDYMKIVS